ncbi:MAG TPA: serine hydrolase domain-containing protein [Thermomicrobiales bacterium]|nr:serine hydrolase domain-containing protein [Thermomicrobiales bacterium]
MQQTQAPRPDTRWPHEQPGYASLAAAVQGEASRWNVPGIAVGILHDGETTIHAFGATSIETGHPVTPETIFQIGSISKVFTATLVMRLVEQGTLDLDTPVITYVPELPLADEHARATVTLRHLLAHSAGFEGDRFIDYGRGDDALAKAIAAFDTLPQWFAPGTLWSYCNAGFYLAGLVIERATSRVFEDVLMDELIKPLGLTRTEILPEYAMTHPHALGHKLDRRTGPEVVRPFTLARHVNAAGGIIANAADLLRFARMHIGDGEIDGTRIISADAARAMREAAIDAGDFHRSYGIGWSVWNYDAFKIVDHGGAIRGFKANLTVIPEKGFALAQLANSDPGSRAMQEIEAWALNHYLGFSRPKPARHPLPEATLDAFTGTYERHDARNVVTRDVDGLHLEITDIDEETGKEEEERRCYDLEPVGPSRFRVTSVESHGAIVDFLTHPAPDGAPRDLMRAGGRLAARNAG